MLYEPQNGYVLLSVYVDADVTAAGYVLAPRMYKVVSFADDVGGLAVGDVVFLYRGGDYAVLNTRDFIITPKTNIAAIMREEPECESA